jgi:hypothetical protein
MSFRTHLRNLKILILLVIKISPFGRNDSKMNYDTVSEGRNLIKSRYIFQASNHLFYNETRIHAAEGKILDGSYLDWLFS